MSREFIIDPILPTNEIHLIAGPSGAGKTTLLMQWINDWQHGKPILGMQSNPCNWQYLSADRSRETTLATIERTATTFDPSRVHSMVDGKAYPASLAGLCAWMEKYMHGGGFLILDGLLSLTPLGRINDYAIVKQFLIDMRYECNRRHVTTLGSVHSSKMREDDIIMNPRQRVAGTVAWAGFSETIILIEPANYKDPNEINSRLLHILPRNAPEMRLRLEFNAKGILIEQGEDVQDMLLDLELAKLKPGDPFNTQDAVKLAAKHQLARRTAERWLTRCVTDGKLERIGKGKYRVAAVQ